MVGRLWVVWLVAVAGCTDTFALPIRPLDFGAPGDGGGNADGMNGDGAVDLDGSGGDGPLALPASCAKLACTPAMNEGMVALNGEEVSGCHAYTTLIIGTSVDVADKLGFAACADMIIVSGFMSANGGGEDEMSGPGAGKVCGSGGGHGGAGADPGSCGPGTTYGDANFPRTLGSGGGGQNPGKGGGKIELAATQINMIGFITADGQAGGGVTAGGGSGGSVLLQAETIGGAGQIYARGGLGVGLAGGGGGGGRIAIHTTGANANISTDVSGGDTMVGGSDGTDGTVVRVP